jgi:hypothetical protein
MPTGREAWAGCEVAGEGLKEERWGAADDGADAEVWVHERLSRDPNHRRLAAGGRMWGRGKAWHRERCPRKEGVREVSERVRDASSACFGHKANVGAIMGKGGAKIKPSDAVSCPECALQGGVMYDDELTWGVDGLCGEVVGGTPKTVPG